MLEAIGKEKIKVRKKVPNQVFSKYVFSPLKGGIGGFAIFFSILIFTKLLAYFIGVQNIFNIDFSDVLLSTIGFVLVFLIKFLENFQKRG